MVTPKWRRSQGFTLLEVMVALTILGISMTALIEIFTNGLKAAHKTRDLNMAMLLAQSKMEQVMLERTLEEASDSGTFERLERYRWLVEIVPWEYPDDLFWSSAQREALATGEISAEDKEQVFRIFEVRVTVGWQRGSKEFTYSVSTLRTVPPEETE